ncbi:hypothetical protein [Helicobacter felis]|uniref:hypothetical protein n=1 Tax=Helicobacter felis TaxID=214 RepID=UPI000CEE18E9|nr:hypothetical protein [Helicobacter felis]
MKEAPESKKPADSPDDPVEQRATMEKLPEPPDNVIRIETQDGSGDYIEIVFDRPVEEIRKEIEEEKRQKSLWYKIKRIFKKD